MRCEDDGQTRRRGAIRPSGVEAKVGQEFDCHFTGPEGKRYTAHMRITNVDGEQVVFDVKSRPS